MKRCMIYPFSERVYEFTKKFNDLCEHYKLKCVVALQCSGLVERDMGVCCNEKDQGIIIQGNFLKAIEDVDVVIICEHPYKNINAEVINNIVIALEKGKEVQCYMKLRDMDVEKIKKMAQMRNGKFEYFMTEYTEKNAISIKRRQDYRCEIMLNLELFSNMNSKAIFYDALNFCKKNKIRAVGISEDCCDHLFNIRCCSAILQDKSLDFESKVIYLQQLIDTCIYEEKPYFIFVHVRGGIMKYNDYIKNSYGFNPFLFSRLENIAGVTLTVDCNEYTKEFYHKLTELCQYHLNTQLLSIIKTNEKIDIDLTIKSGKFEKIFLDKKEEFYILNEDNECSLVKNKGDLIEFLCCCEE